MSDDEAATLLDVNGTPIPKFIAQLRDDAARIRENIAMRPNLDQSDPATFNDMAYTQAMFDMAADTIEKFEIARLRHRTPEDIQNEFEGKGR